MKNTLSALLAIIVISCLPASCLAQPLQSPQELQKAILQATDNAQLYAFFEQLQNIFFSQDKYADLVEFLRTKDFKKKELSAFVDYSVGLARYRQLKFLEESQNWDEYFSKGNDYRQDLTTALESAIKAAGEKEPLAVWSRLVLWQFHRDQMDIFHEKSFEELVRFAKEYGASAADLTPVKLVADTLLKYEERAAAKEIYSVYLKKLTSAAASDSELESAAGKFLQEGNLELAQAAYDSLLSRIAKIYTKEQSLAKLKEIAARFAYRDNQPSDAVYALKVFQLLQKTSGADSLDEETLYSAGYNAEKAKEFEQAAGYYEELLRRFPRTELFDELNFKLGVISAYVSADLAKARQLFENVAARETLSGEVISSLYQLGLLAQWQDDGVKAKEYYTRLIDKAGSAFPETKAAVADRLKEIEKQELIDNTVRTFLDLSGREGSMFAMSKASITASAYTVAPGEQVTITAQAVAPQSGCMQVVLENFWSQDLGTASPAKSDESFNTTYPDKGTKFIALVVASPTGVIDRAIDFINVR